MYGPPGLRGDGFDLGLCCWRQAVATYMEKVAVFLRAVRGSLAGWFCLGFCARRVERDLGVKGFVFLRCGTGPACGFFFVLCGGSLRLMFLPANPGECQNG